MLRLQRPRNDNWKAHFLCTHSMATNASVTQGKFTRGLGTCVFLANVAGAPHSLTGFVVSYTYVPCAYETHSQSLSYNDSDFLCHVTLYI